MIASNAFGTPQQQLRNNAAINQYNSVLTQSNISSIDPLLLHAFPVKDQSRFQNYLRFDVKESSFAPDLKESIPGNFPPNKLQPLTNRKSVVPKQEVASYPRYPYVRGPSAFYMRNTIQQTPSRNTQTLKSSISRPADYYWIPRQQIPKSPNLFFPYQRQVSAYVQQQKQRSNFSPVNYGRNRMAGSRREHITGPSALFSQLPPSVHTYMGIETPGARQTVSTPQVTSPVATYPQQRSDPRWFTWTQGLAQTSGKTHTNTHSNSLQRNDPGVVATDTHVQSSQGSQSNTNVQQMYGTPQSPGISLPQIINVESNPIARQQMNGLPQSLSSYPVKIDQTVLQQMYKVPQNPAAVSKLQNVKIINDVSFQPQQLYTQQQPINVDLKEQEEQMKLEIIHKLGLLQLQNADRRQTHQVSHTHQWGYGNGNGKGHGTGSPGASGSGGGWGTGGPISQGMSLPAWESGQEPKQPPATADQPQQRTNTQQPQQSLLNFAMHPVPAQTLQIWNRYLAEAANRGHSMSRSSIPGDRRQSTSGATSTTDNISSSGVTITPTNGKHVTASNHHWGFGNGNGDGHGSGPGSNTGTGGGWGAGGPSKTTLQVNYPNQRSTVPINPWLPETFKSNTPQQRRDAMTSSITSSSQFLNYIRNSLASRSIQFDPKQPHYFMQSTLNRQQPISVGKNLASNLQQMSSTGVQSQPVYKQPYKRQLTHTALPSMQYFMKKHKKKKRRKRRHVYN